MQFQNAKRKVVGGSDFLNAQWSPNFQIKQLRFNANGEVGAGAPREAPPVAWPDSSVPRFFWLLSLKLEV